jgi:hypothetical protein
VSCLRGIVVVKFRCLFVKKMHACLKLSFNTEQKKIVTGQKQIGLYAYKHMENFTDKLVGIYWKILLAIPWFRAPSEDKFLSTCPRSKLGLQIALKNSNCTLIQ